MFGNRYSVYREFGDRERTGLKTYFINSGTANFGTIICETQGYRQSRIDRDSDRNICEWLSSPYMTTHDARYQFEVL